MITLQFGPPPGRQMESVNGVVCPDVDMTPVRPSFGLNTIPGRALVRYNKVMAYRQQTGGSINDALIATRIPVRTFYDGKSIAELALADPTALHQLLCSKTGWTVQKVKREAERILATPDIAQKVRVARTNGELM
eukprot:sb/3474730/